MVIPRHPDAKRPAGLGPAARWPAKRVVIVDDSAALRRWLRHVLDNDTRLHVVGEAADAQSARAVIKATHPDVITLDVEMPGMDGIEFLEHLMRLNPLPVVMVSALSGRNTDTLVRALSLGAVDCVAKPRAADDRRMQRDLVRRVFSAACSKVPMPPDAPPDLPGALGHAQDGASPIVLLGASTGGVSALETLLARLDPMGPPVVVVQHMPAAFLVSFTRMLDSKLSRPVCLLRVGLALHRGKVAFAPALDPQHVGVTQRGTAWFGTFHPATEADVHCPSVDALFRSAVPFARDVIAGVLTGLGRDGAAGLLALRAAGARTLGQDRGSAVVYGMPRAAAELGALERQVPPEQMAEQINDWARSYDQTRGWVRR